MSTMPEKVAALLRKAESTTNEAEASAFVAKAQALMAKYSIDAATLAAVSGVQEDGGIVFRSFNITGSYGSRKISLATVVAKAVGCKAIFNDLGAWTKEAKGYRYRIEVCGTVADVAWAIDLYESLARQMDAAVAHETKAQGLSGGTGRKFGTGFVAGFTSRVMQRLEAVNVTARREAQDAAAPGAPSVSMVLASKAQRVEDEYRKAHPHTTTRSQGRVNSFNGYNAGQDAGARATIARGSVGGSGQKAIG